MLSAHLILHALPLLPPPYDDIHSAFYDRRLRGQTQKLPQIVLTVKYLQEWMTTTLSCLYLKTHIDQSIKKEAKIFTKKIQDAAVHRLREIDWMDPITKKEAIQKIQRMYVGVGFPDTMPSSSNVDLTVNNLFQNILLLGEERTHDDIKSLEKKKNINSEWDDPIFAVNAYYYSETNQMIIPVGSLLWPFYSKVSPYGWNFGGLGAVIGHEMTHAFDSDGKDYNEYGEKVNWWKEKDLSAYEKKTHAIISLFNKAKVLDHAVNGNKTLNGFIKLCNASDILYFIPDEYRRDIILKLYNSIDRLWNFNINIEHDQRCIHSVATLVNESPLPGKGTIANLNNAVVRYNVR